MGPQYARHATIGYRTSDTPQPTKRGFNTPETIAKFLTPILFGKEGDFVHRVQRALLCGIVLCVLTPPAMAQVTPAAGYVPPDDTPSLRVGMTLYPLFT